jgi:hypothetical protein
MWIAGQVILALVWVALIVRELLANNTAVMSVVGLCLFTTAWIVAAARSWNKRRASTG